MRPAHAIAAAGDFAILKTDYGQHSRRQWARATVGQIVQIESTATAERRAAIDLIRHYMVEAIEPYFVSIPDDVDAAAKEILDHVTETVAGSAWEANFAHPEIRTAILLLLTRNLRSAALALN